MKLNARLRIISLLTLSTIFFSTTSCHRPTSKSSLDVSDVEHSPVKRQSIGNCWLYATASWAESLHISATGETINLSESYWTYWDWFDKITGGSSSKIETGGSWYLASGIIAQRGYMIEGDFIPAESDEQMSSTQRKAEAAINLALSEGSLKDPANRTEENVKAALNEAFGVDIDALADKVHEASELQTTKKPDGTFYSLNDEVYGGAHGWASVRYPQVFGKDKTPTIFDQSNRQKVLKRVLKAVNAKVPVIMSSMVEFAALNTDNNATFEYDRYIKRGASDG